MSKYEELKNMVSTMFENATEKKNIEEYTKLMKVVEEGEKEEKELREKYNELLGDYKEVVKHTSFKEVPKDTTIENKEPLSLEASLKNFLASQKKEN